jgi:hypothetical protein
MRGPTIGRIVAVAAAALVTLIACAPAAWLGDWLASHGPVRLIRADGTIWQGSGMLALSDGRRASLIPGRIAWRVRPAALLSGRFALRLQHPAFEAGVGVAFDGRVLKVEPGAAVMPAAVLTAAGAPFNTPARWDVAPEIGIRLSSGKTIDTPNSSKMPGPRFSTVAPLRALSPLRKDAAGRNAACHARGPLVLQARQPGAA